MCSALLLLLVEERGDVETCPDLLLLLVEERETCSALLPLLG